METWLVRRWRDRRQTRKTLYLGMANGAPKRIDITGLASRPADPSWMAYLTELPRKRAPHA